MRRLLQLIGPCRGAFPHPTDGRLDETAVPDAMQAQACSPCEFGALVPDGMPEQPVCALPGLAQGGTRVRPVCALPVPVQDDLPGQEPHAKQALKRCVPVALGWLPDAQPVSRDWRLAAAGCEPVPSKDAPRRAWSVVPGWR